MKVLIGTDILLCYLLEYDYIDGINLLIKWLDNISATKLVDISSIAILTHFAPLKKFRKLNIFSTLNVVPSKSEKVETLANYIKSRPFIQQRGATYLTAHLNLLDNDMVDFLVTENQITHQLAKEIGLDARVYTIENFIEKLSVEYRDLDESKGVVVRRCLFKELSLSDSFFDDFKREYAPEFCNWYKRKAEDYVYSCISKDGRIKALLKLKEEGFEENYSDIVPVFPPENRLKICSFKVDYNGEKLGERFVRIIFQKAIKYHSDQIYVTIYNTSKTRKRLIDLIERWGFYKWGEKNNGPKRIEEVYVRNFKGLLTNDLKKDYPFHHRPNGMYIIPLHRSYYSQLLPTDTLAFDAFDIMPSKNSIRKSLVLLDGFTSIEKGDIFLFYQKTSNLSARKIYSIGLVERRYEYKDSERDFVERCRKRSTLSNAELNVCWKKNKGVHCVVDFLFICELNDTSIPYSKIEECGISTSVMSSQIAYSVTKEQFESLIKDTEYEYYTNFY